jgi:hypothetical protein
MRKLFLALFCSTLLLSVPAGAFSGVAIYPQGFVSFPNVPAGSTGAVPQTISVYNESTVSATVTSVTLSLPQFTLLSGSTPVTLAPGQYANFVVSFSPTTAKSYTGTMTFNFSGLPSQKISLKGVGTSTTGIATLSATSLNFGSQALGSPAAPQTLTITNTGTTSFNVTGVVITAPFAQTGFSGNSTTLKAGQSLALQIYYYPWLQGPSVGSILITYNALNNSGVSLKGNATAATTFALDTFPTLPSATQSAQYLATLTSAGGIGNVTWSVASGSSLPAGLVLSSAGGISGTLASSVAVGNYNFTVQATDSETPPVTATVTLTLPVGAPTGSACNNVEIKDNGNPLVPLIDLGTGTYMGYQGGLYANGSNVDDPTHDAYGAGLAGGIQPLDANGNPSPTGKYVLISVGQSNTQGIAYEFGAIASVDPSVNQNLVIVNGASGGASGGNLQDPNNYYWTIMTNNYLPNAGVTAKQVVAAWVNDVDAEGKPPTISRLQSELEFMTQNLLLKFPNIKIAYFSSVNYTGYSNGVINLYHEPNAYQAGFAVKLAIQDQMNGNTNLNFNPALGPVVAPWMAWGAYYWVDGLNTRSDGLAWSCQDSLNDGTHPSDPAGRVKASTYVLQFFKTDHTATPWFLAPGAK